MTATDPTLCPGTWPQPVGHTHVCIRTVGHRGQCECLCGSVADSELLEPTTEDPMTNPTTAAPATPGQLDLDAVEARAEAATPGPWGTVDDGSLMAPYVSVACDDGPIFTCPECHTDGGGRRADAKFIAAARADIPALVAEVRRLSGELVERTDRLMETLHKRNELAERLELAEEAADRLRDQLAPGVWQLPAEPPGPLWDRHGCRWERIDWRGTWRTETADGAIVHRAWFEVLSRGPLSTTPPAGTGGEHG